VRASSLLLLICACSGTSAPDASVESRGGDASPFPQGDDAGTYDSGTQDGGSGGGDASPFPQGGDAGASDSGTRDLDAASVDSAPPVQFEDVSINFDELASSTVVTSTYASVRFSSDQPGLDVIAFDPTFVGQSQPNFICAGSRCDGGFIISFTKPVEALHFNAVGVNASEKAATIRVYESGALTKTVDLVGTGRFTTPVPVDLSSAHAVTRVEVTDVTDFAGIGLDDFAFKAPK
jgi:hypothetical protein